MLRRLLPLLASVLLLAACGTSAPSSSPATRGSTGGAASVGLTFIQTMARADDAGAAAMEDSTMQNALPAAKIGSFWQGLVAQYGAFQRTGAVATTAQAPYTVVTVQTVFANETLGLNVTVDGAGQVAGLNIGSASPASSQVPASAPAS